MKMIQGKEGANGCTRKTGLITCRDGNHGIPVGTERGDTGQRPFGGNEHHTWQRVEETDAEHISDAFASKGANRQDFC